MAKIGITKSYVPGALTDVSALFAIIKTFIVDAGFYVITNTATRIEFMPAGTTPAGNTDDDTPHWTIYQTGTDQIHAAALYGLAWDDAGVRTGQPSVIVDTPVQYYNQIDEVWEDSAITFHAAADGREGWFWIASRDADWDALAEDTFDSYHTVVVGTRVNRLTADMTAGLAARYGLFDNGGIFAPPYVKDYTGAVLTGGTAASLGWWSPLTSNGNGVKRHSGSPLAQMAVPVYPELGNNALSPALFGQMQDVLVCTDGYTHLGTAIPGWRTYNSYFHTDCPFALRDPGSFTSV